MKDVEMEHKSSDVLENDETCKQQNDTVDLELDDSEEEDEEEENSTVDEREESSNDMEN